MASHSRKKEVFDGLKFSKLEPREHVLEKPGMYIGDIVPGLRTEWICNPQTLEFSKCDVSIPPGLVHLFIEVLMNASDNVYESRKKGLDPGTIEVVMVGNSISVKNYGRPIPVAIHEEYGVYNPLLIFGNLMTSSHYEKNQKRFSCGTNGLGAKLTNVWSKYFRVKVKDTFNKKEFEATWVDNMEGEPTYEVKNYKGSENSVEIEWVADLERFGYENYPPETASVLCSYLIGVSVSSKIPVSFNGIVIDMRDALDFCKIYWGDDVSKHALIYREYEDGTVSFDKKADYSKIILTELVYLDTPDNGTFISFANAMNTMQGGCYVDTAYKTFSDHVLPTLKQSEIKLTVRETKLHTSVFLNCLVENPEYLGQNKGKLNRPDINLKKVPPEFFNVKNWNLIKRLKAEIEAKQFLKLKKSDSKKAHYLTNKLEDANLVMKKPSECTLHICEGDSASGLPRLRIGFSGGHDYNGILVLGGKLINVLRENIERICENPVIKLIKQALNLQETVDYSLPENRRKLKYGKISIETDADDDGRHICGLLLNYFNKFYPSILQSLKVCYVLFPVVKIFKGKKVVERFTSLREFDEWQKDKDLKNYNVQYYKGLGSYEKDEVQDDLSHTPDVFFDYDESARFSLKLAFDGDKADDRKAWISRLRNSLGSEIYLKNAPTNWRQSISSFVNNQVLEYSLANLQRSIPRYNDGMKNVHRKIMTAALEKWNWKPKDERTKVSSFAGSVQEAMNYHHGPMALEDTIKKMAFSFVGSNNLPLLQARSMMGTRNMGGKDAPNGRYCFISLPKYIPYIFRKELVQMIPKKLEDGERTEYEWIPGVIPMLLVNGTSGIATGHSTKCPPFHPRDLIRWIREKCSGTEVPQCPVPYFHGFTGKIELKNSSVENELILREETNEDVEEEIEKDPNVETLTTDVHLRVITYGKYDIEFIETKKDDYTNIIITELPVGRWTIPYSIYLKELNVKKPFCKQVLNKTDELTQVPYILLENVNMEDRGINYQSLMLVKSYSLQNITLLDRRGYPRKYNIPQILQRYYEDMIGVISAYREKLLEDTRYSVNFLENKIKFLECILDESLKLSHNNRSRPEKEIINDMTSLGIEFQKEILNNTKIKNLTEDQLDKLKKQAQELRESYIQYESRSPQQMWLYYLDELEKVLPY